MVPMLFTFQRNIEAALSRRALQRQIRLERSQSSRGVSPRATALLAALHSGHVASAHYLEARVTEQDVGREYPNGEQVEPEDVGKFWFVEGYSRVGGPDVIRPGD